MYFEADTGKKEMYEEENHREKTVRESAQPLPIVYTQG